MARTLPQSVEVYLAQAKQRANERSGDDAARDKLLAYVNERVFARECEAAGMPADSVVSPALLRAMGHDVQREESAE